MNEEKKILKNKSISDSLQETRERRKNQLCKVFEVKVDSSHLNKTTMAAMQRMFLEAKWLYNYALSQVDIYSVSDKIDLVNIKVQDNFEERELNVLGSQIKQSVLAQLYQNIINLSKKKKSGYKIGRLKFINRCESIELKQFGNTYRIKGNRIKIQGISQWFRVRGLEQCKNYEIANAKFINKAGDFYLKITCFKDKLPAIEKEFKPVGTDFGIKSQITFSNGVELKYNIQPGRRMKMLCRQLSKKVKHSSNWYKAVIKLQKEYNYFNNVKKDTKNKIVSILKSEFNPIIFQNDCMQGWQRIWGRRMLNTAIGGIIADFRKSATTIEVDRFFPSTKRCSECHHIQKIGLDVRIFECEKCNFVAPRDLNSGWNIQDEGLKIKFGIERKSGAERICQPVESDASTLRFLDRLNAIPPVNACLLVDAGSRAYL